MANRYLIKLICKLPSKMKRRLMLMIDGDNAWLHGGKPIGAAINSAIDKYVSADLRKDKLYIANLIKELKRCYVKFDLLPAEYFYFEFEGKSDIIRSEYLTDSLEDEILINITGYDKYLNDLSNKWHFYELAKPFFLREVMQFNESSKIEDFVNFVLKVKDLFIKPLAGSEGEGAFTLKVCELKEAEDLFVRLKESHSKWMVEERIKQSAEMSAWNKSSINTVRVPAFLNKNGFYVLGTVFRTGRNNNCVDNIAAGGIFAHVDEKTGVIITNGLDVKGSELKAHPESGLVYKGWQIPRWQELLKTAEAVHRTFPSHIFIAWDFALTDKGWDLIEGNWGRLRSVQIANSKGIKNEFLQYMNGGSIK